MTRPSAAAEAGAPVSPAPASQPAPAPPAAAARRPETRPAGDAIARAWAELTHRDPAVREAARLKLAGMSAGQLPEFRRMVAASRPLAPSQAIVLREIVSQVFLAAQTYDATNRDGFLGVRPVDVNMGVRPEPAVLPDPPIPPGDPDVVHGVMIGERFAGFCGARAFQDGDIILSLDERPELRISGTTEFSMAVRMVGAGQTIHFRVLRQGRVVRVPLTLDVRPDAADPNFPDHMLELLDERNHAVREYWDAQFGPLLKETVG